MSTIPLPPNHLPALDPLVNGDLWARWASEGRVFPVADVRAAIRYLRLKPDDSCRLTVFGGDPRSAEQPPALFLVELYANAERAALAHEKACARHNLVADGGFLPFLARDVAAVGIPFPNDPVLAKLRTVYQPDRFRRALIEVLAEYPEETWRIQRSLLAPELLVYKPERRAVYRLKVKLRRRDRDEKARLLLHVKVATPADAEQSLGNLRAVHQALPRGAAWRVPRPFGLSLDGCLAASEWATGEDLFSLLEHGGPPGRASSFSAAGEALAGLHRLELTLPHRPSPVEESDEILILARDLARLRPDRVEMVLALGDQLACGISRLALTRSSIVHGDFHPGQVLHSDTGGTVLVDFDAAGRGWAVCDLGSFLARIEELGAPPAFGEALLAGYVRGGGTEPDPALLALTTAAGLYRRAIFPLRELRETWPEDMDRLLDRAGALLEAHA